MNIPCMYYSDNIKLENAHVVERMWETCNVVEAANINSKSTLFRQAGCSMECDVSLVSLAYS